MKFQPDHIEEARRFYKVGEPEQQDIRQHLANKYGEDDATYLLQQCRTPKTFEVFPGFFTDRNGTLTASGKPGRKASKEPRVPEISGGKVSYRFRVNGKVQRVSPNRLCRLWKQFADEWELTLVPRLSA